MKARKRMGAVVVALAVLTWMAMPAAAHVARVAGDLTAQKPIVMHLQLGTRHNKLVFRPNRLRFHTGRLYKLILHNASHMMHEFDSPDLMERVFHDKVVVLGRHDRPMATIAARLDEVQLVPGETVAWYFVPVKTTDKPVDFVCGLPGHEEAGMKGEVVID